MIPLSQEYRDYREVVRGWLSDNLPSEPLPHYYAAGGLEAHLAWEQKLKSAGYAALNWPTEYGGGGADDLQQLIFAEEYTLAGAPHRVNRMALGLAGPTIIMHGTGDQKKAWLPNILDCEDIWCQGFSEPEAGSDLAGLKTSGEIVGDEIVLNGHKTWSSYAKIATKMIALVRTDTTVPKHKGITFLVIDLTLPGVEIRPIDQLHGNPGFAEVLFEDVHVPIDHVIGNVNDGWNVAMSTLSIERSTEGSKHAGLQVDLKRFRRVVDESVDTDDGMWEVAKAYAGVTAFRDSVYLGLVANEAGRMSSHPSYQKLLWSNLSNLMFERLWEVQGAEGEVVADGGDTFQLQGWQRDYWHARASRIFAGSDQIQRNIIAERVLGLPKERPWLT